MVPSKEDYRSKAEKCLQLASEITDVSVASLLRMVAADYCDLGRSLSSRAAEAASAL
jgi:hypothetical protein